MKPQKKRRRAERDLAPAESNFVSDPRRHGFLAACALCAITLLAYSNSFQTGFAFDNILLLGSPQIQEATGANVRLIFQHTYWWPLTESGLYRPFTTLSYLFNYAVLGDREQSAGYHWINILLHGGNVLLVHALASRLVRKFWPAFFIALIWAVHPGLTESVTNIVGRADLLAAMSLLSGFLMYLNSKETAGGRQIFWLAGLMAVTTVGVFSKESAVAVLGIIILYELIWWKERGQIRTLLLGCLAVLLPTALMLYQRSHVLARSPVGEFPFTDNPILGASFWQGRLTALTVIPRYLWLLLWPAKLSNDYSYAQIPLSTGTLQDWMSWIVVAAVVVGAGLLFGRNRTAFFLVCFAAVTFVPVSNLLFPIGTIMAERFLYLPSIGLLAGVVLAIYAAAERFPTVALPPHRLPLVLGVIAAALALRTLARNPDWQSNLSLFKSAAEASPGSYKAHHLLARYTFNSDASVANSSQVTSDASLATLDIVIGEAEKSLAILDPLPDSLNMSDPYLSAGEYYVIKGDYLRQRGGNGANTPPAALAAYQRGLQVAIRGLPVANANRAARNLRAKAAPADNSGVAAAPLPDKDPEAYELLSVLYQRTKDLGKAMDAANEARAIDSVNSVAYHQLASVLFDLDREDDAAVVLAQGIAITANPGLRQELLDFYRRSDPKGCEIVTGTNGPGIDPSCATVRKHFCAASVDALKATLQAGERDLAENERTGLVRDFGCPAAPLDQVLASASK